MTLQILILVVIGALVCGLGFFVRLQSSFELIRPRFVIPSIILVAVFAQPIIHWIFDRQSDVYSRYREEVGPAALSYVILCVCFFWVGIALPLGATIGKPLVGLVGLLPVTARGLRPLGYFLCTLPFVLLLLIAGPSGLGTGMASGLLSGSSLVASFTSPFMYVLIALGSVCIGLAWPQPGERSFITVVLSITCLLFAATPFMASFSRGTGLTVMIASVAYILSRQKFSWFGFLISFYWLILCSHAGLVGRGIYGHYAGIWPYLQVLFTNSIASPREVFLTTFEANDSFTALCVTMKAVDLVDTQRLTVLQWFVFQIPLPRIFGIHPDWTFNITPLLGGTGSWNYLSGIFGDTFAHFGWAGSIVFTVIGALYRLIDYLCFTAIENRPGRINLYMIVLFTSYLAFSQGIFNNFRSFIVGYTYPLYLVIFAGILLRAFLKPHDDAVSSIHQNSVESTY